MHHMTLRILFSALLALHTFPATAKLRVVATTADLASLAQAVGGSEIDITTLARPTEDPHFVEPKPSLMLKLNRADALLHGGAELEQGWLGPLIQGCRNSKIQPGAPGNIPANQGIQMLEIPDKLDRSKGDIHAAGNPHYLIDPINAKVVSATIAEAFTKLDPGSASVYRANCVRFAAALDAKLAEWLKQLEPCKGQCVVAYHNSWVYFARRFGFTIDLFLEPKPGIPPSPAHLGNVIAKMRLENAHVILADVYTDQRTAETVAARTDAVVVEVSQFPGGLKGTESGYIALLDRIVADLAKAFKTHQAATTPK
jgi:ABC-type Zn uptake system ZnuABC Zn-binding protein ZnuA